MAILGKYNLCAITALSVCNCAQYMLTLFKFNVTIFKVVFVVTLLCHLLAKRKKDASPHQVTNT